MKKERLASLLMTGAIMASTVVSASAMQFPQDVYYPSDDTGLAQKVYMVETEKEIELLTAAPSPTRARPIITSI